MADLDAMDGELGEAVSQERFGEVVGISQQAVSDLTGRGVLAPGDTLGVWLLAYCSHLREQAAGRGADGELARERARLSREQADRVAMENAAARKEVAPIALITLVLGKLAADVASTLDALLPQIRRRVPDVSSDVLRVIEETLAKCRQRAAAVSMADADDDGEEEDED